VAAKVCGEDRRESQSGNRYRNNEIQSSASEGTYYTLGQIFVTFFVVKEWGEKAKALPRISTMVFILGKTRSSVGREGKIGKFVSSTNKVPNLPRSVSRLYLVKKKKKGER
jgi:hypothetical protein